MQQFSSIINDINMGRFRPIYPGMYRTLLTVSLWFFVAWANTVDRSSKRKRVTFEAQAENSRVIDLIENATGLIEKLRSSEAGQELLTEVASTLGQEEESLTGAVITAFWIQRGRLDELDLFSNALEVDIGVLEALNRFSQAAKFNLLQSYSVLSSTESLRLMAQEINQFSGLLRLVSDAQPGAFVESYQAVKEAIADHSILRDFLWQCIIEYGLNGTGPSNDSLKCLHLLVSEFLSIIKNLPLPGNFDESTIKSSTTLTCLVKTTIQSGNIEFLRILLICKAFPADYVFEDGIFKGNALMFVQNNAEILSELIAYGVSVEDLIFRGQERGCITVFSYLFQQSDPEMNAVIWPRRYQESTYLLMAKDAVLFGIPKLADFAVFEFPQAQSVIDQTINELKMKQERNSEYIGVYDEATDKIVLRKESELTQLNELLCVIS